MKIEKEVKHNIDDIIYVAYQGELIVYECRVTGYEYTYVVRKNQKSEIGFRYFFKVAAGRLGLISASESAVYDTFEEARKSIDNEVKLVGLQSLKEEDK